MKVYVDELPKCCSDCPCFYDESISCQASDKWLDLSIEKNFNSGKQIHKKCPLQSLTELKKQIRKEVVQEIREKIIEEKSECEEALKDDFNFFGGKMMKLYCEEDLKVFNMVIDIIDQIEGEINGKID